MSEHVLNREFLLSGRLGEEIRRWSPDLHVLTDEERAASLATFLAERPEGRVGLWVFAYGSLIWNPMVHHVERRPAHTPDWHRSFCLATKGGRGTPDNPMTTAEIEAKAIDLVAPISGEDKAKKLVAMIGNLSSLKSVRALRPLLQA